MDERDRLRASWGEENFVGGALCMDFANTFNDVADAETEDRLVSYPALTHWAAAAGAIEPSDKLKLDALAEREPAKAAELLAQARALRAALLTLVAAVAAGKAPAAADLARVEQAGRDARSVQRLTRLGGSFSWVWPEAAVDAPAEVLARPLWPVALSALDILTDPKALALSRQCVGPTCTWVFLDTTKNHKRRWCDMRTCGNQAKARRHYTRKRGQDGHGDKGQAAARPLS